MTTLAETNTTKTQLDSKAEHRFEGMLQILRFNWMQYTAGALTVCLATLVVATVAMPAWVSVMMIGGTAMAVFWLVASLVVSHWIYDRSSVFDVRWVSDVIVTPVQRYANIHFGFDTGTEPARAGFPDAVGTTWDVFDHDATRERSLLRARATATVVPEDACDFRNLPASDESFDAVFLMLTAHELRDRGLRERFFGELARLLAKGGSVVIVEHARDLANFVAFGFGFVHFLPASEWLRLADVAGLTTVHEHRITPFVRAIVLRK